MRPWELPTSLKIRGVGFPIRTDFRDILKILTVLRSKHYEDDEKNMIFLIVFYPTYRDIPKEHYKEALEKAVEFIDMGLRDDNGQKKPSLMDWEKDAAIVIPAVNRVLGLEVRSLKYLHWWTFLGAYLEIGESLLAAVLNIRQKKAKGQKLEKHEAEFYRENRGIIDLEQQQKRTDEEVEELNRLFGLTK